jgi:chromosome segregation ATPase
MNALDRLHQAEAEVAVARERYKKFERESIEQQIREFNQKGRAATELFKSLDKQFRQAEEAVTLAQADLQLAESRLARHNRPLLTEFPTDEETAEWEREHARLAARSQRAQVRTADAQANRESIRMKLLQAHQEMRSFQSAVVQLTNRLEQK